jgi:hypothetical protein
MQRWLCGTGIFNPPARYSSPRATGIHKLDSRGRVSANPRDDEKRGRETRPGTFYLIAVVLSRVSGLCPDQVAFV